MTDVQTPAGVTRPEQADADLAAWLQEVTGKLDALAREFRTRAETVAGADHLAARVLGEAGRALTASSSTASLLAVARSPITDPDVWDYAVDALTGRMEGSRAADISTVRAALG